jgi:hypothetical protein
MFGLGPFELLILAIWLVIFCAITIGLIVLTVIVIRSKRS